MRMSYWLKIVLVYLKLYRMRVFVILYIYIDIYTKNDNELFIDFKYVIYLFLFENSTFGEAKILCMKIVY